MMIVKQALRKGYIINDIIASMKSRYRSQFIFITIGIILCCSNGLHADNDSFGYSAQQLFKVESISLSPNRGLLNLISLADSLYRSNSLTSIEIEGTASPDGPISLNARLSLARAEIVKNYLTAHTTVPSSLITTKAGGENWEDIEQLISGRDDLPFDTITDIVNNCQDRNVAEQRLRSLPCWPTVRDEIFPLLRRSLVTLRLTDNTEIGLIVSDDNSTAPEPSSAEPGTELIESSAENGPEQEPQPEIASVTESPVTPARCRPGWHLESNALEWGLMIANAGVERDLGCHWSANLSIHFSAMNYMTSTRKFRTFIIRPEARYWLSKGHHGMFVEGHLQMASYNFALSRWNYRIQDVDGKTPALGGGLGLGYRLGIGSSGQWALQAQIGAGVYRLKYDRFENRINGALIDTRSRTWCGIDNVAISIVYNFNTQER